MFPRSSKMQRTPPQQGQNNTLQSTQTSNVADESTYICDVCLVTDVHDKVCCDGCDKWSHFECVGVTADIANQDWFCNRCLDANNSNATGQVNVNPIDEISNQTNLDFNATNLQSTLADEGNANPPISDANQLVVDQTHLSELAVQPVIEPVNTVTIEDDNSVKSRSHKSGSSKSTTSSSRRKSSTIRRRAAVAAN